MQIDYPVHPDPAKFETADDYVRTMDQWWSRVMQEELVVLADRLPMMQMTWRARWYSEHFPGRRP